MKKAKLFALTLVAALSVPMMIGCSKKIPEGFVKLNAGTVTESIGGSEWPFGKASKTPVTVNAFYMAQTETTYERWYEVYKWATSDDRGATKYTFANPGREGSERSAEAAPTSASKEPVTKISWRDAVVWCNAASEKDGRTPVYYLEGTSDFTSNNVLRESEGTSVTAGSGKAENAVINSKANGYRLPTEAEWEYAARGGDPAAPEWSYKYAGTNSYSDLDDYAVHCYSIQPKTADVASKKANSAGLYDMSGNITEWCQDFVRDWDTWFIQSVATPYRVGRGGDWSHDASNVTVTYRFYADPYYQSNYVGFRVAFSITD